MNAGVRRSSGSGIGDASLRKEGFSAMTALDSVRSAWAERSSREDISKATHSSSMLRKCRGCA
jgi:hypothetical protein